MSEEQFKKLSALQDLTDLKEVADIVKDTKVGQGLKFLPRTLDGLHKSWQLLQEELDETGSAMIINCLAAVLQELNRCKIISYKLYVKCVGIFFKETLPRKYRDDLSFEECIVVELRFGCQKIFFTVLYRNPTKHNSSEFLNFMHKFEDLHKKIKEEKPYIVFLHR